jgi:hypothetical protein
MQTITKLIFALLLCNSCQSLNVASFDPYSFEKTIELKNKTTQLLERSTETYANNSKVVESLLQELQTHYDYENSKANNHITIALWERMTNKETSFIRSYFGLWKTKEKLSTDFINEAIKQTNEAFDKIITLETKKEQNNGYSKTNFRHQKSFTTIIKREPITSVSKN